METGKENEEEATGGGEGEVEMTGKVMGGGRRERKKERKEASAEKSGTPGAGQMASRDTRYKEVDIAQLKKDSCKLKKLEAEVKKSKSKREKNKEEQVRSVLLAGDAAKKTLQSIELASRIKSMYGAQDTLAK